MHLADKRESPRQCRASGGDFGLEGGKIQRESDRLVRGKTSMHDQPDDAVARKDRSFVRTAQLPPHLLGAESPFGDLKPPDEIHVAMPRIGLSRLKDRLDRRLVAFEDLQKALAIEDQVAGDADARIVGERRLEDGAH
jgi:hypothetical protein